MARRHNEAGFTLVELLVVVFIIGLMAGLVVVNLPPRAPPGEVHARALTLALHRAARESIISGQPVSWALNGSGRSRFERYVAGQWQVMSAPGAGLEPLRNAPSIDLGVEYPEGGLRPRPPEERKTGVPAPGAATEESAYVRQVVFSPVGEATPADIFVRSGEGEYGVRVSGDGKVEWRGATSGAAR